MAFGFELHSGTQGWSELVTVGKETDSSKLDVVTQKSSCVLRQSVHFLNRKLEELQVGPVVMMLLCHLNVQTFFIGLIDWSANSNDKHKSRKTGKQSQ